MADDFFKETQNHDCFRYKVPSLNWESNKCQRSEARNKKWSIETKSINGHQSHDSFSD